MIPLAPSLRIVTTTPTMTKISIVKSLLSLDRKICLHIRIFQHIVYLNRKCFFYHKSLCRMEHEVFGDLLHRVVIVFRDHAIHCGYLIAPQS